MDQVKSDFYASQILEAVETVAAGIVSKIKFDQTILCTIINDEKKKDGIYEVSDGSSTFTATSGDTNYSKDMVVYVLIPQGDYENQKTIVGKYVDDSGSAVNYIPDSESIIEIVTFDKDTSPIENVKITPPNDEDCWKLLANDRRDEGADEQVISGITLFELPFENYKWNNTNVYTCASLKAKFRTDLSQYNILKGDYGLRLTLEGYKMNESGEAVLITGKPYIFSCADMYGDPYNYNTYYEHDIVFDLEEQFKDVKINNIKIEFYQDNNFIELNTSKGIPSTYSVKNNFTGDIETQLYSPNLFVKDISLSFGYTTETIKEEGIKIYTPDDLKYINRDDKKDILLKWFTKNQIGSKTAYGIVDEINEIPEINKNNLSIYWYRYVIDNSNPDPILGKGFWQLIPGAVYQDKKYVYKQQQKMQYDYDSNKKIPVVDENKKPIMENSEWLDYELIEDKDSGQYYIINDKLAVVEDPNKLLPNTMRYNKILKEETVYDESTELKEPFKYFDFGPNELLDQEKIKAVLQIRSFEEVITEDEEDKDIKYIAFKGEQKIYESNELIFENKNPAEKNLAAVNLIRNMRLECADGSEGVYMIYNSTTNKIIDAQKNNNILNVYFDNYLTQDISKVDENCKITWKIPENSMIEPVNFTLNNKYLKANIDTNGNIIEFNKGETQVYIPEMKNDDIVTVEETTSSNLISWNLNKDTHYWECSYYWTGDESLETSDIIYENQYLSMHYGLNPFYTRSENNTIFCEIEKYGKVYKAELKMFFGSAGTSGTKYTLIAELEKEYGTGTEPSKEPTSNERVRYLTAEKPTGSGSWPWVKVIATLFDEHFKDISEKHKFSWSFKNNNQNSIEVYNNQTEGKEIYIRLKNNIDVNSDKVFDAFTLANYYCILEVITMQQKTTSDENGPIVALQYDLPIGVRIDTSIGEYTGTEKLIYDAQGRLPKDESFQELHVLRNSEAEEISNLTWSVELINASNNNILQYLPTFDYTDYEWKDGKLTETKLTSNNILKPKELYFSNLADQCIVITACDSDNIIQFVQPIIYGQNKYGISVLNNWDGHQLIDAAGNKILTALVGAGLKEENNTFSGVFIGEIGQVGSEDSQTGLLGLHEGVHTFGFHTDGTAFIGPSGSGRINFDGTKSTISSGNYDEGKTGTLIDLDDGSVEINPNEILIEYETFETFFNNNKEANEYKVIEDAEQDFISEQMSARIQINSSTVPYFHIQGIYKMKKDSTSATGYDLLELNGKEYLQFEYQSLIYIDNKDYFLQSLDYKESTIEYNEDINDTTGQKFISSYTPGDGFRIDLANKEIQAYKFKLSAGENVPEVGNMVIEINSDSSHEYPLVIGDHFKVSWLGDIYAINGIFEGNITASSGSIGGWTIGASKLYFGQIEEPINNIWEAGLKKAILSPEGVSVFKTAFTKEDNEKIENVVFNIGTKFVLQNDGTLYLDGAQIGGYAHEDDLSNMSQSLQNTITNLTADFNTNIGKINLKAEGSINYLGELNDNVVFLTTVYKGGDENIVLYEGFISDDNTIFYDKIFEYEGRSVIAIINNYYQDLHTNTYYKCTKSTDPPAFEKVDSLPLGITLKKGYYDQGYFWEKIKGYKQSEEKLDPISHDFYTYYYYFDIKNNKLYQYDSKKLKYILTDSDEVYLFSVSSKGLLQAQNAVISGTIYANAGHIGGWTIQRIQNAGVDGKSTVGSLTYGNTDANYNGSSYSYPWVIDGTDANLTPGEGLLIQNETLFEENDINKWCTLNVGKNFAVTTDGILYATGVKIKGNIEGDSGYFSGTLKSETGYIGDWHILENQLIHGKESGDVAKIRLGTTLDNTIYTPIREKQITKIFEFEKGYFDFYLNGEELVFKYNPLNQNLSSTDFLLPTDQSFEGYEIIEEYEIILLEEDSSGQYQQSQYLEELPWKEISLVKPSEGSSTPWKITITWKEQSNNYSDSNLSSYTKIETNPKLCLIITLKKGDNNNLYYFTRNVSTDEVTYYKSSNSESVKTVSTDSFLKKLNYDPAGSDHTSAFLINTGLTGTKGISLFNNNSQVSIKLLASKASITWDQNTINYHSLYLDNTSQNLIFNINPEKSLIFKGKCIFNGSEDTNFGGFKLNGDIASDLFWNNALFTNNAFYDERNQKYSHYIGFLRCVGDESNKLSNVFLGCKQINKSSITSPSSNDWSNTSTAKYNFYIRFDGKIYTKSNIEAKGNIKSNKDILSYGAIYAKKGLQVDGYSIFTSHNLTSSNTNGSISIVGTSVTLSMDSNAILVLNTSGTNSKYSNLYLIIKDLLPGFSSESQSSNLGSSNQKWNKLFVNDTDATSLAMETSANVSDMRLKFTEPSSHLLKILSIYNGLRPVAYKYKNLQENENHSRIHVGFIAQEVENEILKAGLTNEDFAAVQIAQLEEPIPGCEDGKKYYLNYNEFHGLHVLKNQEQDSRIQELENKVQALEQQILELRGKGV